MPRQLRIQYPGAIYHVMSRGDRLDDTFLDDVDRHDFLKTLAEACQKIGCQVHARCLALRWTASRLHMGSWTCVSNLLSAKPRTANQRQATPALLQQ